MSDAGSSSGWKVALGAAVTSALVALLLHLAARPAGEAVAAAGRLAPPLEATPLSLLAVTALGLGPGDELLVRGTVRTTVDGSLFEALPELLETSGSGLVLVDQDRAAHVHRLRVSSPAAPACAAAGVPPPCLVPRLKELAHQRLLTVADFQRSLEGQLQLQVFPARRAPAPLPGRLDREAYRPWAATSLGLLMVTLVLALAARRHALRRSPLGQVVAAAERARRRLAGEPLLVELQGRIAQLVGHAGELEQTRRLCRRQLARLAAGATQDELDSASAPALEERATAAEAALHAIATSLRAVVARAGGDALPASPARTAPLLLALNEELELREAALAEAGLQQENQI